MHISNRFIHLNSDNHKNHHDKVWCEDCNKYISDQLRHFQSEIHLRNKQINQLNQQNNFSLYTQQSCPSAQSASGTQQSSVQSTSGTQQSSVQSASGASATQQTSVQSASGAFSNGVEIFMKEKNIH